MARRRLGRVNVDFAVIEKLAAGELAEVALRHLGTDWRLSRKSALHRCKNGTFTLCLIWKSGEGTALTHTVRGIRVER